ncbi:MAG: hypothetical protein ACREXM_08775 [Gammaproteobacteria bacterium]
MLMLVSTSSPPLAYAALLSNPRMLAAHPGIRATAIPIAPARLKDPGPGGPGRWWRQERMIWSHRIAVQRL